MLLAAKNFEHRSEIDTNAIVKEENITHFIEYYSCNYKELREHPLGKQLLYVLPGKTAKQWKDENPIVKGNMRDVATLNQLLVLTNTLSRY